MKKIFSILLAALLLTNVFTSCGRTGDDESDYLPVCLADEYLCSECECIYTLFPQNNFWEQQLPPKRYEDSALSSRKENVFGEETELFYKYTYTISGHDSREYKSTDWKVAAAYSPENDRLIYMLNNHLMDEADQEVLLSEEEYRNIAIAYVEQRFPLIKKLDYQVQVFMPSAVKYVKVLLKLKYLGYAVDEYIDVHLTPEGTVFTYNEKMKFPDGLPDEVLSGIEKIDFERVMSSVEHSIHAAEKQTDKKLGILDVSDFRELRIRPEGSFACMVTVSLSIDGKEETIKLAVPIRVVEPTEEVESR